MEVRKGLSRNPWPVFGDPWSTENESGWIDAMLPPHLSRLRKLLDFRFFVAYSCGAVEETETAPGP